MVSDEYPADRTAYAASQLAHRLRSEDVEVEQTDDHHIAVGEPDEKGNAPLTLVNDEHGWEIRDPYVRGEVVEVIEHGGEAQADEAVMRAYLRHMRKNHPTTG